MARMSSDPYAGWGDSDPMAGPSLVNLLSQMTADWGYNPGNVERAASEAAVRGASPRAILGIMGRGQETLDQREKLNAATQEAALNRDAQMSLAAAKLRQAALEAALQRAMKYDLADEQNARMRDFYGQLGQRWTQDRASKEAIEQGKNERAYGVQGLRGNQAMDRARLRSDTQMGIADLLEGGRNTRFDTGQQTKLGIAGMQDATKRDLFGQGQEGLMARLIERLATTERGQDFAHADRAERNRIMEHLNDIRERLGMARVETAQRGQDIQQGLGEGRIKLGYDTLEQRTAEGEANRASRERIAELNSDTRKQIAASAGIKLTPDQEIRLDTEARKAARDPVTGKVDEMKAMDFYQANVDRIRDLTRQRRLAPPVSQAPPVSSLEPQGSAPQGQTLGSQQTGWSLTDNPLTSLATAPLTIPLSFLKAIYGAL